MLTGPFLLWGVGCRGAHWRDYRRGRACWRDAATGWRGPRAPGAQVDFAWPDPGPHGGRLARAGGRSLLTHFPEKNEAGVSLGFPETSRCLPEPRKGPQETLRLIAKG